MLTQSPNTFLRLYKYLFGICILLLFSTACKKESGFTPKNFQQEKATAKSYKAYIDSLSLVDSSAKHLSNTLLWNNLISINLDSSKRLVYVPSSLRNRTNIVNGLVFIESLETDTIIQSFYTQIENLNLVKALYRTAIEKYEVVESANTIANYFTRAKSNFNGNIQFFTNRNKYLFTIGIENGRPSYFKAIKKAKKSSKEGGIQANSNCVDYYLTTFYDDGSTETEFLFQSCTRDCIQTRVINTNGETVTTMACGDSNSINAGGGGDGGVDLVSILNLSFKTGELILLKRVIKPDGSIEYRFADFESFAFSVAIFTFTLDKNNRIVPESEKLDIAGLHSFTLTRTISYNPDVSINKPFDGYVNSSFTMNGIIDIMNSYSIHTNIIISMHIPQNSSLSLTAYASYGYLLPFSTKYIR